MCVICHFNFFLSFSVLLASAVYGDSEDPYPSLSVSDFDFEPNLEFDDTELEQAASTGKILMFHSSSVKETLLLYTQL